jgi:hypothetical protein
VKCPQCGAWSQVLSTRGGTRRRECGNLHRFTTCETVKFIEQEGAPVPRAPQFAYNKTTGEILKDGIPVGTKNTAGYIVLRYMGQVVYAHRLAFFLETGVWPELVDHIDGDKANNQWINLRIADPATNSQNRALSRTPNGLPPGAHLHRPSGLIKSAITVNGKQKHLGYFKTPEEASRAYIAAKQAHHNEAWKRNDQVQST